MTEKDTHQAVPTAASEVENMNNLKNAAEAPDELFVDPEEEKKVIRKLDCYVMPIMALVYFFQCMGPVLRGVVRTFIASPAAN